MNSAKSILLGVGILIIGISNLPRESSAEVKKIGGVDYDCEWTPCLEMDTQEAIMRGESDAVCEKHFPRQWKTTMTWTRCADVGTRKTNNLLCCSKSSLMSGVWGKLTSLFGGK